MRFQIYFNFIIFVFLTAKDVAMHVEYLVVLELLENHREDVLSYNW